MIEQLSLFNNYETTNLSITDIAVQLIGTNKLIARANKLHKQSKPDILDFNTTTENGAELSNRYEQSLSER